MLTSLAFASFSVLFLSGLIRFLISSEFQDKGTRRHVAKKMKDEEFNLFQKLIGARLLRKGRIVGRKTTLFMIWYAVLSPLLIPAGLAAYSFAILMENEALWSRYVIVARGYLGVGLVLVLIYGFIHSIRAKAAG